MNAATRIIAIRHGETAWNRTRRIQGHTDIDLNDTGRTQAERAGVALHGETIAAIYSSDLQRAHHTALAIARYTLPTDQPVQTHVGLRERHFGQFEGHTYEAIETQWPDAARRWKIREPGFAPAGGESPIEVMARVRATVDTLAEGHLGAQIVLVAHGGVMDMLYRLATQQTVNAVRTWELANAAINRLLWTPDGLTLVGWGDVRHLDGLALDETTS